MLVAPVDSQDGQQTHVAPQRHRVSDAPVFQLRHSVAILVDDERVIVGDR